MTSFTEHNKVSLEVDELKKKLLSFKAESGGKIFKPEPFGLGNNTVFHSLLLQLTKESQRSLGSQRSNPGCYQ